MKSKFQKWKISNVTLKVNAKFKANKTLNFELIKKHNDRKNNKLFSDSVLQILNLYGKIMDDFFPPVDTDPPSVYQKLYF